MRQDYRMPSKLASKLGLTKTSGMRPSKILDRILSRAQADNWWKHWTDVEWLFSDLSNLYSQYHQPSSPHTKNLTRIYNHMFMSGWDILWCNNSPRCTFEEYKRHAVRELRKAITFWRSVYGNKRKSF